MFPSGETQTRSLPDRTLAGLRGFTDVWLHKTNVSIGKSYKQALPSRREDEHTAAFSLHNPRRMFTTERLEGKPPPCQSLSRLFHLRPVMTAYASNTFTSVTSQAQLLSVPR